MSPLGLRGCIHDAVPPYKQIGQKEILWNLTHCNLEIATRSLKCSEHVRDHDSRTAAILSNGSQQGKLSMTEDSAHSWVRTSVEQAT